jgi:glycosyltransferase involved in cell wall biosynthesis
MDFRTKKTYTDIPLVTIGVLSYNYSQYIDAALNSLLLQTYPNIELIIVDDKSEEDSAAKISRWIKDNDLKCTFIQNEKNQGITKVSNLIVSKAKGKYLSLFATDDIMLPEKIERQVNILEEAGEEYGLCYANTQTMDEDGVMTGYFVSPEKFVINEGDILERYVFGKVPFATPSTLIRRSVYDKIGLYEERILIEDYNLWLRLFACFKVKYCDYPCLIYRVKKESGIWNRWGANKNERYFHDRIISNHDALKFIDNEKVRKFLESKISQYLKSLAYNKSRYTKKLIKLLVQNGYYKIPAKVLVLEGLNSIKTKKEAAAAL